MYPEKYLKKEKNNIEKKENSTKTKTIFLHFAA